MMLTFQWRLIGQVRHCKLMEIWWMKFHVNEIKHISQFKVNQMVQSIHWKAMGRNVILLKMLFHWQSTGQMFNWKLKGHILLRFNRTVVPLKSEWSWLWSWLTKLHVDTHVAQCGPQSLWAKKSLASNIIYLTFCVHIYTLLTKD